MPGLFNFYVGCCLFLSALGVRATISGTFCDRERNEVYCDCINPCNTCEERGQCSRKEYCVPGCDCIPGFYRNRTGYCVPEYSCDAKCKPDEVYLACGPSCPDTCSNYGKPRRCTYQCVPGCFCKPGLVRAPNGRCIIPELCGNVNCNADEEFQQCGTLCPDTCDNYGKDRYCALPCVRGCFCKRGLVRRNDFKCVIPEKCNKRKCNRDEVFKTCGTACPKTCENYGRGIACTEECVRGCFCAGNTVRDVDTKKCVPRDQCPKQKCYFPNEEYSLCVIPCNNCEIKGKCNFLVCNKGCDCIRGYYRDELGRCIPEKECPARVPTCKRDEQYYQCIPCGKTCETYNKPVGCPAICTPGCDCKVGLVRRWDGKCVTPNQCNKPSCGFFERYTTCVNPCNDCIDRGNCAFFVCNEGCDCINGFYRKYLPNGPCIPASQCPGNIPTCNRDEQYYQCIPCGKTCEAYNKPVACPAVCTPGCDCKYGLVRRWDGKCVKPYDCPKIPTCKRDEQYYPCIPCGKTCEKYNKPVACPAICTPGCDCKYGLVRRWDGKCVKPYECPKQRPCGKNEEFSPCNGHCPPRCDNLNPACPRICIPGCICKKCFAENKLRVCIPVKQCPRQSITDGQGKFC